MTNIDSSRRIFLKTLTTTALIAPSSLPVFASIVGGKNKSSMDENPESDIAQNDLPLHYDGPGSPLFEPLDITGNFDLSKIDLSVVSVKMAEAIKSAPTGNSVAWGIPFNIPEQIIYLKNESFKLNISPRSGNWIVFMHTSDQVDLKRNSDGFYEKPFKGLGQLNEEVARYYVIYEDGTESDITVRQRHHIGMFQQMWGENCIESVANYKPGPVDFYREITNDAWGWIQTRVSMGDRGTWINWLWAWENPNPGKKINGFRFEPLNKS